MCSFCVLSAILFFEECGKLDPLSEEDIYCLHFVYIPRIIKALDAFRLGWNNHAITTEHCMTPLQLFTSGTLSHGEPVCDLGEDMNGTADFDPSGVIVPQTISPLNSTQENELKSLVDPLQASSNYGIEIYDQVKQYVSNLS